MSTNLSSVGARTGNSAVPYAAGLDHDSRLNNALSEIAPDKFLQLGLAFCNSKTLLSEIELGAFTQLGKEPLPRNHCTPAEPALALCR